MTEAPPLRRLEAELQALGELLDQGSKGRILLNRVAVINNLIGMMARSDPELRAEMVELQRWINLVTVGIKSTDLDKAKKGLESSLRAFNSIMRKLSQKNL